MTFLSLKGMLVHGLNQLLLNQREETPSGFIKLSHVDVLSIPDGFEIPIRLGTGTTDISYVSAIPQLIIKNKHWGQSLTLLDISEQVVSQLRNQKSKLLNNDRNHKSCERDHKVVDNFVVSQLWDELKIETKRSGWVSFHLSAVGVDLWLRHLNTELSNLANHFLDSSEKVPHTLSEHTALANSQVWQAQYIHARCCSLIRLWNAQVDECYQVRNDTDWDADCGAEEMLVLGAWCECDRPKPVSAKPLVIHALVQLLDLAENDLFWIPYHWPSKQYFLLLKAIDQLCQSFEQFLAIDLSGFGQVGVLSKTATKRSFRASFALALIVGKTLEVFLEAFLAVDAPTEI